SLDCVGLLQVLDSKAAADFLARSLSDVTLDDTARTTLLRHLGVTTSTQAGHAVLKVATDDSTSDELRRLALNLLGANLFENWKDLKSDTALASGLGRLLARRDWQTVTLALIGDNGLDGFGADILAIA